MQKGLIKSCDLASTMKHSSSILSLLIILTVFFLAVPDVDAALIRRTESESESESESGAGAGAQEEAQEEAKEAQKGQEEESEDENMGAQSISGLTSGVKTIFTSEEIDAILPHRYPFALVDKVVEYTPGKSAVGIKTVTKNEPHFTGHFPERAIMPGVLQVEALAQLAGIVSLDMEGAEPGALFFFAGVNGVRWKRPVVPGDVLVMEVEMRRFEAGIAKATGTAYVDGQVAVQVKEMTFALAK